jgi:hypothetical protein
MYVYLCMWVCGYVSGWVLDGHDGVVAIRWVVAIHHMHHMHGSAVLLRALRSPLLDHFRLIGRIHHDMIPPHDCLGGQGWGGGGRVAVLLRTWLHVLQQLLAGERQHCEEHAAGDEDDGRVYA